MSELMHYGAKGMHWGERRYQNLDGSLTPLGKIHYGIGDRTHDRELGKKNKDRLMGKGDYSPVKNKTIDRINSVKDIGKRNFDDEERKGLTEGQKKVLKMAGGVLTAAAITAGAVYIGTKMDQKATDILKKEYIDAGAKALQQAELHELFARQEYDRAEYIKKYENTVMKGAYSKDAYAKAKESGDAWRKSSNDYAIEGVKNTIRGRQGNFSTKEKIDVLKREASADAKKAVDDLKNNSPFSKLKKKKKS